MPLDPTQKKKIASERTRRVKLFLQLCSIQWLHGSNSRVLEDILSTVPQPALVPTGEMLDQIGSLPNAGSLNNGINHRNGINKECLSGVSPSNYEIAFNYAKRDVEKQFATFDIYAHDMVIQQIPQLQHLDAAHSYQPYAKAISRFLRYRAAKVSLPALLHLQKKLLDRSRGGLFSVMLRNFWKQRKERTGIGLLHLGKLFFYGCYKYTQRIWLRYPLCIDDNEEKLLIHYAEKTMQPSVASSWSAEKKAECTHAYPIVWATNKVESPGAVLPVGYPDTFHAVYGIEIARKGVMPLGNDGINFAFTNKENVTRLRERLLSAGVQNVTVLSFEVFELVAKRNLAVSTDKEFLAHTSCYWDFCGAQFCQRGQVHAGNAADSYHTRWTKNAIKKLLDNHEPNTATANKLTW